MAKPLAQNQAFFFVFDFFFFFFFFFLSSLPLQYRALARTADFKIFLRANEFFSQILPLCMVLKTKATAESQKIRRTTNKTHKKIKNQKSKKKKKKGKKSRCLFATLRQRQTTKKRYTPFGTIIYNCNKEKNERRRVRPLPKSVYKKQKQKTSNRDAPLPRSLNSDGGIMEKY